MRARSVGSNETDEGSKDKKGNKIFAAVQIGNFCVVQTSKSHFVEASAHVAALVLTRHQMLI